MAPEKRWYLILLVSLALFAIAPGSALASPPGMPLPQTAPCFTAAMQALTRQGAIYSQGGYLADDPTNPATGQPYPRTGPDSFDCSGLVWWAYAQAGISIGATTYQQINNGVQIPCTLAMLNGRATTCWALGDLVFLQYVGGQHVAIYVGDGLFMDCYNQATGCILHNIASDRFYQAHFAQARRIVSGCEGLANDPGTPETPNADPLPDSAFLVQAPLDWSTIPDLVGYVSFAVPQCNSCSSAPPVRPLPEPEGNAGNWLDLGTWINWLGVRVWNIAVNVICILLMMLQIAVNAMATIANQVLYFLNTGWKFALFAWLTIKAWLYASFVMIETIRATLAAIAAAVLGVTSYLQLLIALAVAGLALAGQLVALLGQLAAAVVGLVGWIGGLTLSILISITSAFSAPVLPPQISGSVDHVFYRFLRGVLDGLLDSSLGWLMYLGIGMAYVSFFIWIARYLPGKEAE